MYFKIVKPKNSIIIKKVITILLFIVMAVFAFKSMGHSILGLKTEYSYLKILLLVIFIYVASLQRITSILFCILDLIVLLYSWVGMTYGPVTSSYISALCATTWSESVEVLSTIPTIVVILSIIMGLLLICYFIYYVIFCPNKVVKSKKQIIYFILFLAFFIASPFFSFIIQFSLSSHTYWQDRMQIDQQLNLPSDWQVTAVKHPRKLFVVVIGESMRRDFMSAYHYPLDTTPFMRKSPNLVISNYVSSGSNTIFALTHNLVLNSPDRATRNLADNAISLAEAGGYKTYWLSNQGFVGLFENPITAMALKSQYAFFLKAGSFGDKANSSDLELLPHFKKIVQQSKEDSVIFVHIMGSHNNPCDRLVNNKIDFHTPYGKEFNCYLSSYRVTDYFIQQLVSTLQSTHKSYSLMYFSDHGEKLSRNTHNSDVYMTYDVNYKQDYQVPLVFFDSQLQQKHLLNKTISGYDFIDYFANWLGIKTKQTQADKLFSSSSSDKNIIVTSDMDFNGLSENTLDTLNEDNKLKI